MNGLFANPRMMSSMGERNPSSVGGQANAWYEDVPYKFRELKTKAGDWLSETGKAIETEAGKVGDWITDKSEKAWQGMKDNPEITKMALGTLADMQNRARIGDMSVTDTSTSWLLGKPTSVDQYQKGPGGANIFSNIEKGSAAQELRKERDRINQMYQSKFGMKPTKGESMSDFKSRVELLGKK